jgi:hypothetical protein
MSTPLEDSFRNEERSTMFDIFEQALFDICTGAKLPDISPDKANVGFEQFIKLSNALHTVFGAEWPNR